MTLAGLEPAIPGSVGRCLIHWATRPSEMTTLEKKRKTSSGAATSVAGATQTHKKTALCKRASSVAVTYKPLMLVPRVRLPTPMGFEPMRAEPNGFRVHLLNRSDTVSCGVSNRRFLTWTR